MSVAKAYVAWRQKDENKKPVLINTYKKTLPRIKGVLEKRYPVILEKHLKTVWRRIIDWRHRKISTKNAARRIAIQPFPLFTDIEIETINRCNGTCSFCPVNKNIDPRTFKLMEHDLFISIIKQLQELGFSGTLSLSSNNEPLLDNRIAEFCRIAKEALPKAFLYILTNGTLLTIERLNELMCYLDRLTINNYNDKLKLNKSVEEIYNYCVENEIYQDRIEIHIRKQNEFLTTRAGQAKNRSRIKPLKSPCLYPYHQLVVRPDGKISLCCNDALGEVTMGDLTKERIIDVWRNEKYGEVRKKLLSGRKYIGLCSLCDA